KSSKRIHQSTDNVSIIPFSMIVSRRGCLQAVGNQCEFVGNEREQSVRLVGDESEQRNAMFASRGADVCKLLQIAQALDLAPSPCLDRLDDTPLQGPYPTMAGCPVDPVPCSHRQG